MSTRKESGGGGLPVLALAAGRSANNNRQICLGHCRQRSLDIIGRGHIHGDPHLLGTGADPFEWRDDVGGNDVTGAAAGVVITDLPAVAGDVGVVHRAVGGQPDDGDRADRRAIDNGEGVHAGVLQEHDGGGCGLPRLSAVLSTLRRSEVTEVKA
jgi:hypothetical protein